MSPSTDPVEARIDALVEALPLDRKTRLLSGATAWTTHAEPAIGLRPLVMSDGPVGVRGLTWDERDTAHTIPSPTAMAASWDTGLIERLARLLAGECRRKGVDILLAPTINLHRTPLGGRHFECFSEDPLLTARIGTAYVEGLQSAGVAATPKHFVANDSETERMTYEAVIEARPLRELYLKPFEEILRDARPWLVMAAYNGANGPTMTENPLLDEVLKAEWGFDGAVVSDWGAVRSAAAAGRAGTDLAMPGPETPWTGQALLAAVRAGEVPEPAIDEKVRRLVRLAARVGALDGFASATPVCEPLDDTTAAALAREAAAAGMVLARNDGVLPLRPSRLRRVALIGPNAAEARIQGGGSARVAPMYTVSPLQGLTEALRPEVEVVYAVGAHTATGLRPFDRTQVSDPVDGSPGVRVRLRDASGRVWRDEHRDGGWLLWMGVPEVADINEIEVSCVFRAPADGVYRLGFGGVGEVVMTIDGRTVFDGTIDPSLKNHFAALLAPIDTLHALPLTAGQEVALEVRLRPYRRDLDIALLMVGVEPPRRTEEDELAHAAELAAASDVAVVVVGTTEQIESEGFDRTSITLPGRQDDLVAAVAAANPNTIVVVNSGGPVAMPWLEDAAATLLTWFPGQESGHALADVLTGAVEPGGRMPTTWTYRAPQGAGPSPAPEDGKLVYREGLHIGYRAWLRDGAQDPVLPFGSGLGYTTWRYDAVELVPAADGATARVTLSNVGARPGAEVVQVYLARPGSSVERPARWLVGFAKVRADDGQTVTVDVPLPARVWAHWSEDAGHWVEEPGEFEVHVGGSVASTPLQASWTVGPA
ncbi:MAG: beta-glucosidase [Actinomycetia bacterium]|nr:beta-glucosidase [Actinomycetes bacterium]